MNEMGPREELLKAFKVGPDDLAANRSGTLSARQKQQLTASGTRNLLGAFVMGAMLAAILFFISPKPLKPVQIILAGILFVAVLFVGISDFRKTRAAAALGRAECLTGPVQVQRRGRAGFYLRVAGKSFKLGIRFWHLQNGASYRVYVATGAGRIVAMEPDG